MTDTQSMGHGFSLEMAVADLNATASAEIFLETAEYVLVTEGTRYLLPSLKDYIRPGAKVVLATGPVEAQELTDYLEIQKPEITLLDCMAGGKQLPKLMTAGERYYLVQ